MATLSLRMRDDLKQKAQQLAKEQGEEFIHLHLLNMETMAKSAYSPSSGMRHEGDMQKPPKTT